nr:MAG: hypothetical protein TU36_05775 [Vulcanisaeta sp. AZ3]
MLPEAVPIIGLGINHIPRLTFTNKLGMEVNGEIDQRFIRGIRSLGKEVIGVYRFRGGLGNGIPKSLNYFDKSIIIMNSGVGDAWIMYVINLGNYIIGLTLDALMRLINVRPHLLNLPNELFIDPIIDSNAEVLPRGLPRPVVNWLLDYVDSGGDLYLLVRPGSLGDMDLITHSSLVFTYDIGLAETYNALVKNSSSVSISANCGFCDSQSSLACVLLCPDTNIIRELRVD